jgi:hypothetical protein
VEWVGASTPVAFVSVETSLSLYSTKRNKQMAFSSPESKEFNPELFLFI